MSDREIGNSAAASNAIETVLVDPVSGSASNYGAAGGGGSAGFNGGAGAGGLVLVSELY